MKAKWNTPELLANDAHGVYMMQIGVQYLLPEFQQQIRQQIGEENWTAVMDGPNNEWYFEACDSVTNCTLKTKTGQKFSIGYYEGGLWLIPACFAQSKEFENWF